MSSFRERCTAFFVCFLFASLQLFSAAPSLHRHDQAYSFFPAGASASIPGNPANPAVAERHAHKESAPGECPACAISGLFAVVSGGLRVAIPTPHPQQISAFGVGSVPTTVVASLRSRAPPLA